MKLLGLKRYTVRQVDLMCSALHLHQFSMDASESGDELDEITGA